MIRSFFKIAWRNLLRNKGFSLINISGLAIGMAAAVLIMLWINHELSYDQFHEKKIVFTKHGTGLNSVVNCSAGILHPKYWQEPWKNICPKLKDLSG